MKKTFILLIALLAMYSEGNSQQKNTGGSMPEAYTRPMVEEAPRNIILQNRAGNRVTFMFFEEHTDLQFVYKPNAFRRKEHRARNFSNRDNYTELFPQFRFPQLKESFMKEWDYDPFFTQFGFVTPWEAKGKISVINLADENAFALVSRAPLLISVKPHQSFDVQNGLLTEKFTDRGEEIVSFIKFNSLEENRFRVTTEGEYVLQVFENEVILVGGEENMYQVDRVCRKYDGMNFKELLSHNEAILAPKMNRGIVQFNDPDFQEVIDLNHRIVYSGIDEGGACFGALNRIYYLIWVRDGSMTTAHMARAGNPELIKLWTKFLLDNPSVTTDEHGNQVKEFLQIVGTRWTKTEDDGIFYAMLSLFTYFQTTGRTDLIEGEQFPLLLDVLDAYLKKVWNDKLQMVVSDTRGETPLKDNPYFGYDVVNGNFENTGHHRQDHGKSMSSAASLYHQVNAYNILKMAAVMLEQRPDLDGGRKQVYLEKAGVLQETIRTKFVDKNGYLYAEYLEFDDGSTFWQPFARGADYWEYAWAVSQGPYFPALDLQQKSARMVPDTWPKIRTYGYCPWNTVSRMLYEYGMSSKAYKKMLTDEVNEAMILSKKYPMKGALTEYYTAVESWRALPFSAGSFFFSVTAQMIQSMPMGIGIRASENVDRLENYQFRLSTFDAIANGEGDVVDHFILNGDRINHTLQIPENRMRFGNNEVIVHRTKKNNDFRLYSSTAQLLDYEEADGKVIYHFYNPIPSRLVFENFGKATTTCADQEGNQISLQAKELEKTNKTSVRIEREGSFSVTAILKK